MGSIEAQGGSNPPSLTLNLFARDEVGERAREQQTSELAEELRSIRGVQVSRARGEVEEGAKAVDLAVVGEVIVALGGAGGAVTALVGVLRAWIKREKGRKIRVVVGDREIELTGARREEERELISLFERSVERG
jgi:hypothetical protein